MLERLPVDPEEPEAAVVARAADHLRAGGLVAFPTETVYGLGASGLDPEAVERIYRAKDRPPTNPLILHVAGPEAARELASEWPDAAEALARAFWPGPLTLVVRRREGIPDIVTAGLATVGVRVPGHPVALALMRTADLPVAAPSANPSGRTSATTADHVLRAFPGLEGLLLDAGPTPRGIESTVLDVSGERPTLLRPGSLSVEEIEAVVGPVARAGEGPGPGVAHPSPGMQERHYAPRAELRVVGWDPHSREAAARAVREEVAAGGRVGALLLAPAPGLPFHHPVPMPPEPEAYARHLYATLHALDDLGCSLIWVDPVPPGPEWEGIRDRLRRAGR